MDNLTKPGPTSLDRAIGTLIGLTTGDALGSTVEFEDRATIFRRYGPSGQTEMRGGGPFGWQIGQYTDDGQMMMCLLNSLVTTNAAPAADPPRLDVDDLGRRFVAWLNSNPPDVGNTVAAALGRLKAGTPARLAGDDNSQSQANGAVMRCAPVAVLWANPGRRAELIRDSLLSAAPTHRSPIAAGACVVVNLMIAGFINGLDFEEAFKVALQQADPEWQSLLTAWDAKGRPREGNTGWAVSTVLTALHCLYTTASFEEAVIKAVNGGGDADTIGAVTGELAGAFYGYEAIPARWLAVLQDRQEIVNLARTLFELGRQVSSPAATPNEVLTKERNMGDELQIGATRLRLVQGDIVEAGTEAIVNAANEELAGGGGVDGAIHRAAGPELYDLTAPFGGCPTGEAVITGAGRMRPPTRYIIHAVGPIYNPFAKAKCRDLLAGAYRHSLELAQQQNIRTIAFPSISTGVYHYPIKEAAPLALQTVTDFLRATPTSLQEVVFILFSAGDLAVYRQALAAFSNQSRQ